MNKRNIIITFLIVAAAVVAVKMSTKETSGKKKNKKGGIPLVSVIKAVKSDISEELRLTGSVEPYRIAQLASPAEGPVLNIGVREADHVSSGVPMISIGRKKGAEAMIVSLREEFKKEEDNLKRTRQLVENRALPGEQLDQAKASYEKIRALLIRAEEKAQDYIIKSPWRGVVSRINVKEGEFVPPRKVLLTLYDPSSLIIRTSIPEKYATEIDKEMEIRVALDAYPEMILKGHIERIYPYLDPRLRTRTVEIVLNKKLKLLPGMFARITILINKAEQAITVPEASLVKTSEGTAVFIFKNGKAVAQKVKTGIRNNNRIEIISGIIPGDKIIVKGNTKLKDGAKIRLIKSAGKR